MANNVKPRLSIGEKLKLIGVSLFVAPCMLAIVGAQVLLFAIQNSLNIRLYLLSAGVRVIFSTFTAREIQTLLPSTEDVYRAWIRRKARLARDPALKERLQCDIQPLSDGNSSILWVGNRHKARKVVLYLHGGGYVMPSQAGHFECVWNSFVLSGLESDTEVAVAFLQYSLAPASKVPVQLRQAAFALSEILKAGFSAKDIIIGGDSAGGNLTMQTLKHLVEPHPEACHIALDGPLSAAVLVSPWLSTEYSSSSCLEYDSSDMLSRAVMRSLTADASSYEEQSDSDETNSWAKPLECRGAWIGKLHNAVRKIHMTVGGREILADQATSMAKAIEAMKTDVQVTVESDPNAAHDFIVAEGILEQVGEATIKMKQWFKGML
ncbi:alpha/beta hydrolase fold domain-containing protein [Trichoderma sp. SZMC 28015]